MFPSPYLEEGSGLPNIQIPEVFRPGIAKLASLPDQSAAELLSALQASKPTLNARNMADGISTQTPSISREDVKAIVETLVALCAVRFINSIPLAEFIDSVLGALSRYEKLKEINTETLRTRLPIFLQIDQLVLSAKAGALQRDHAAVFLAAHSITDIRPIFADSAGLPQGAVLVHTLKLSYLQENESRELFVAMDDQDLETLQKVINRSQEKGKALRVIIEKADLASLEER